MGDEPHGLDRGLTNYGDRDFARSRGISPGLLSKPVVGIAIRRSRRGVTQAPQGCAFDVLTGEGGHA